MRRVGGGGDVRDVQRGVVSNGHRCCSLSVRGVDGVNTVRCFPRSFRALSSTLDCAKPTADLRKHLESPQVRVPLAPPENEAVRGLI
jgi:hypothetical protein